MLEFKKLGWAIATIVLAVGSPNDAKATDIGHHTVNYWGTISNWDGTSTATWAVTENGCDTSSSSLTTAFASDNNGKGKGKGGRKEGTNCNSMSHIAFSDFLCDPSDLVWPDGTGEELYWTDIDAAECDSVTHFCLETVYRPNYGSSPPDGPGDWIKFSNHTTDPQTVQLEAGYTHVFSITFEDGGNYIIDQQSCTPTDDTCIVTHAAVKIGRTVVIGEVQAPGCLL